MPGALDRHGQGALLAGVAVGLAPVGNLATLIEAAAQTLDVLVVDDLAGAEDGLLPTTSTAAETAAPAAAPAAALRSVTTTWAVSAVSTRTTTGTVATAKAVSTTITAWATTGTIAAAGAVSTTIATAITAGGTLGTGAEPGASTLLAGRAGLLACLR